MDHFKNRDEQRICQARTFTAAFFGVLMTQIFVGNLDYKVSEADLRRSFESYGRVASVRIMTEAGTGRSRGFAFVSMPRLDDADEAIHRLNGTSLCGRNIVVNQAQAQSESKTKTPTPDLMTLLHLN
jgi:RNA recognition motif-containing protein